MIRQKKTIRILEEHLAILRVPDFVRRQGVYENTICRWISEYGGMRAPVAKWLREQGRERAGKEAASGYDA